MVDERSEQKVEFGVRLRRSIRAAGFKTDAAFADRLEIGARRLNNYTGGYRWMEPELLGRATKYLGVTADYLLWGRVSGLTAETRAALEAVKLRSSRKETE